LELTDPKLSQRQRPEPLPKTVRGAGDQHAEPRSHESHVRITSCVWLIPLATTSDAIPHLVYQRDVRSHVVSGLMGGLISCVVFGGLIGIGGGDGLSDQLLFGLQFGLMFGLPLGLVSGFRAGAAPSLKFAEIALWSRGRRVRFMPLLETALARQVLRQAGAVYQFRHADLQNRLADRYEAQLARHRPT
jgi:hypothetical protein